MYVIMCKDVIMYVIMSKDVFMYVIMCKEVKCESRDVTYTNLTIFLVSSNRI